MSAPTLDALPTAPQLLCAFQGRRVPERMLLRFAHALVGLHKRRSALRDLAAIAEIDSRRIEHVDEINEWVGRSMPQHRQGALLHTESLGAVIDRMAGSWVAANQAIEADGVRSDRTHRHWYHLAELVDGYTDLVGEVAGGRRRLPVQ